MDRNFYIMIYSIIVGIFLVVMFILGFSKYNKNVLSKSFIDTKIYVFIVFISAIFYVGTIIYARYVNQFTNLTFLVFASIFLAYAILIMITLLTLLKPIRKITDSTSELAKGKRNLNIDFEGAIEFDKIADDLEKIQANYRKNDKKLNKKDDIYQQFIAKNYLKYFGKKKIEDIGAGENVQVKLSILFCDMRNSFFSSETLSLEDNFNLIKDFTDLVSKNVKKNNGFVDRFVGDGIVAVFENENDAYVAASEISKNLDYKNMVSIGKESINFGISLNSGMCIVGVVGTKKQKQFMVVSDVVNLCSRIEGLNKLFGTRVLMTKNFMNNLTCAYSSRYVGIIEFDDLTGKIPVFESLDAYSAGKMNTISRTVQDFESGVRFYEKGEFVKAKQLFALCLKNDSEDKVTKFYLSKTIDGLATLLPNYDKV